MSRRLKRQEGPLRRSSGDYVSVICACAYVSILFTAISRSSGGHCTWANHWLSWRLATHVGTRLRWSLRSLKSRSRKRESAEVFPPRVEDERFCGRWFRKPPRYAANSHAREKLNTPVLAHQQSECRAYGQGVHSSVAIRHVQPG
jgi:hypothetical protein